MGLEYPEIDIEIRAYEEFEKWCHKQNCGAHTNCPLCAWAAGINSMALRMCDSMDETFGKRTLDKESKE